MIKRNILVATCLSLSGFPLVANCAEMSAEFTVSEVGASLVSNSVFVNTVENATSNNGCDLKTFKMSNDNAFSDKFYSTMLAAQVSGRKIKVRWDPDAACFSSAIAPKAYWLLD